MRVVILSLFDGARHTECYDTYSVVVPQDSHEMS